MLIINPTSTCDVCLEGYIGEHKSPHAIPCGHVFCGSCLHNITNNTCPLCRARFHPPQDIRKLHIDRPTTILTDSDTNTNPDVPSVLPPDASTEARTLLDTAKRYLREGAKAPHFRLLGEQCSFWMRQHPREQHGDMYLLTKLLTNMAEWYSQLHDKTSDLRRKERELEALRAERDTILAEKREQILVAERKYSDLLQLNQNERVASDAKYQELLRRSADEKETALAVEKSLRDHYEKLNADWRQRYDSLWRVTVANERPLGCTCVDSTNLCRQHSQEPIHNRHERTPPLVPVVPLIQDPTIEVVKAADDEDAVRSPRNMETPDSSQQMIYFLSPLNLSQSITPISSTIDAAPLPANDDDHTISKVSSSPIATLPSPHVESIYIPPHEPSGLSISRPRAAQVEAGLSRSLPVQGSVLSMHRPPPSPTSIRQVSSALPIEPRSAADDQNNHTLAVPSRTSESGPIAERSEDVEILRVKQLHDLLDSPLPSSRVAHLSHSDSIHQPRTRSYSSSSLRPQPPTCDPISRPSLSAMPTSANILQPPSTSRSTTPTNTAVHSRPGLTRHDSQQSQRKVMSSASSAAQAIEREQKERRRAEREKEQEQARIYAERLEREQAAAKEREREAQRDRDWQQRHRLTAANSSASLRDATNATYGPGPTQHHRLAHSSLAPGHGKGRIVGYVS